MLISHLGYVDTVSPSGSGGQLVRNDCHSAKWPSVQPRKSAERSATTLTRHRARYDGLTSGQSEFCPVLVLRGTVDRSSRGTKPMGYLSDRALLARKVAVVTGGAGGLGWPIARDLGNLEYRPERRKHLGP